MVLKTIDDHVENIQIVNKSRFICELFYVENEDQVKEILESIKLKHPKARHHCYAYIINQDYQNIENQSDDGEPSKTAGIPMLEILRYENLVNVLAIVTRYFGGTLLGTGGLIRAYSSSVKQAVDIAVIKEAKLLQGYKINVEYSINKKVEYELKKIKAVIKNVEYKETVEIIFYTDNDDIIQNLVDITNSKLNIIEMKPKYL